jgi:MFS family permease
MPSPTAMLRAKVLERLIHNVADTRRAFALLASVQVTLIFAITVISIALPALQRDLGLRPGQLVLVSAGYGLAFSGLLLLGGRLADLVGDRRVLVTGLWVFASASIGAALAPNFVTLLAARLLQGVGGALAAPAAMALLQRIYVDDDRRQRAVALWGSLAPMGATAGIVASGGAVTLLSWRWAFVLPAAVATAAALLAPHLLPAGRGASQVDLDVAGAALVTVGASALTFSLVTAADKGWATAEVPTALALSLVALAALVAVEARAQSPIIPLTLLRSASQASALWAVLVTAAGHASLGFFLALYFQQIRGMSALATSGAFLPFCFVLVASGPIGVRLIAHVGPRVTTVVGLGVAAGGLLLIAPLGVREPYAGPMLAGMIVFPLGAAWAFAGGTVSAVHGVDPAHAGVAGGVTNTAVELGPTIGLAGLVSLAGTHAAHLRAGGDSAAQATAAGYSLAIYVAAAAFAVTALATAFLGTRPAGDPADRLR